LKIIQNKDMIKSKEKLEQVFQETEELIAIVAKSIVTAKNNNNTT